jgi:hypothetical protein
LETSDSDLDQDEEIETLEDAPDKEQDYSSDESSLQEDYYNAPFQPVDNNEENDLIPRSFPNLQKPEVKKPVVKKPI